MRHAIAVDRKKFFIKGIEDRNRPLSKKGKAKFEKLAPNLQRIIGSIDLIISSPFVRAEATTKILKLHYPQTKQISTVELIPSKAPEDFVDWFNRSIKAKYKRVLVVGHEPQLTSLVSWLLVGENRLSLELKKGGALAIENEGRLTKGSSTLKWLVSPSLLLGK